MASRLASSSASTSYSSSTSLWTFAPRRLLSSSPRLSQAPAPLPTLPRSHFEAKTPVPRTALETYQRYPNHPLLAFFDIRKSTIPDVSAGLNPDGTPKATKEITLPVSVTYEDMRKPQGRRSWKAPELRRKSSLELHQLWYVLIKERNLLDCKLEEVRRNGLSGAAKTRALNTRRRKFSVRASLGRIKLVLNERRLALLDAKSTVNKAALLLSSSSTSNIESHKTEGAPNTLLSEEEVERARLEDEAYEQMKRDSQGAEEFSMGEEKNAGREGISVQSHLQGQGENKDRS